MDLPGDARSASAGAERKHTCTVDGSSTDHVMAVQDAVGRGWLLDLVERTDGGSKNTAEPVSDQLAGRSKGLLEAPRRPVAPAER
jgi:hypothetical protein